MSLAKRLDILVLEGQLTEAEADELLEAREAIWTGQEKNGQFLLRMKSENVDSANGAPHSSSAKCGFSGKNGVFGSKITVDAASLHEATTAPISAKSG